MQRSLQMLHGLRRGLALSVLAVLLAAGATAQTAEPILEIDTGGHQAVINDVMFTADGQYLVSAADDKTVRVWDVRTGETVRVLRGEIGDGDEGKIFAAALSPDNRLLAVGGWFPGTREESDAIRLIDFRTRDVLALLKGHTSVVLSLAFSPDGRRLLSGSFDKTARMWELPAALTGLRNPVRAIVLEGHADDIYAVAFAPDGQTVVTGSNDDTLKLWDVSAALNTSSGSGKLLATLTGHADNVRAAAFTPDGQYLLSGSDDKTIRLWEAHTGKFIKTLATQETTVDSLSITPDGKMVVTGKGCCDGNAPNHVFAIPSGQQITKFTQHDNIVFATAIAPDGKTAATGGGQNNAIYLWDLQTGAVKQTLVGKGRWVWSVGFAPDGASVAWGKTQNVQTILFNHGPLGQTFQIKDADGRFDPMLGDALRDDRGYVRGVESVQSPLAGGQGGVTIRTKDGKIHPTLEIVHTSTALSTGNGKVIHEITPYQPSTGYSHRALTLTPDGKIAISGGSWGVIAAYDPATGNELRKFVGHTGDVWGVAVSPDGALLVSGSADQTVKLWDIASGTCLLTIFQGTDKEWVAWTPEGYYTASLNGGRYVGWHVNRGADKAADYYTVDQYEAIYYRPDIVALAVQLRDTQQAIAQVLKGQQPTTIVEAQPPKVWFVSPQDRFETDKAEIQVKVKTEDVADATESVIFKVNHRAVKTKSTGRRTRPTTPGAAVQEITETVSLVIGENWIEVEARGTQGAYQTTLILVIRKGVQKTLPTLYYLGVGVAQHSNPDLALAYPVKDVTGLADILKLQQGKAFADVKWKLLTDQEATRGNIIDAAETFFQSVQAGDVAIFFVSGHGMNSASGGYHFIAYDTNPDKLTATGLSWEIFDGVLKDIKANVLLLADTCHSGNIVGNAAWQQQAQVTPDEFLRETNRNGVFVFASSSGSSVSLENPTWGHGAFTKALIDGLTGEAAYKDGVVKISYLQDYVRETVRTLTENTQEPRIPQLSGAGEFLDVVLAKGK